MTENWKVWQELKWTAPAEFAEWLWARDEVKRAGEDAYERARREVDDRDPDAFTPENCIYEEWEGRLVDPARKVEREAWAALKTKATERATERAEEMAEEAEEVLEALRALPAVEVERFTWSEKK